MARFSVKVEISSYWHAGSGAGRGADVDALVLKGRDGIPYLPGRTLKGLLREGMAVCEELGHISPGRTDALFGKPAPEGRGDGSVPGALIVSGAALPEAERLWLASKEGHGAREALFDRFASTRISEDGTAEDCTLRAIELCIPLTLHAEVEGPPDAQADLEKACSFVRGLGSHRSRGLGRCRLSIEPVKELSHA